MEQFIDKENILNSGIETIKSEIDNLNYLLENINNHFVESVELILKNNGRVIITGIGKSAIIAQKIVATMNSTGTPSIFMHAADAIHGDLGIIQKNDVVICISKSGNTPEIKVLIPLVKKLENKLIAIVGDTHSFLAQQADFVLNTYVEREACPHNLAPTTSTTAQLLMGDALAIALLKAKKFSKEDFSKYHPGGALGKRLYYTVADILSDDSVAFVNKEDGIKKVIVEITSNRKGAIAVIENNKVIGMITDGDIRRMLENFSKFDTLTATDIMNTNPKIISSNMLAIEAVSVMKLHKISQLIVEDNTVFKGIIHIHDILKEGINE